MRSSAAETTYAAGEFPARILQQRTCGNTRLTRTGYGRRTVLPQHAHEQACLVFVADGTFLDRSAGTSRPCGPGSVIYRAPGAVHANEFDEPARCLNVEFGEVPRMPTASFADGSPVSRILQALYREICLDDGVTAACVAGLLRRLHPCMGATDTGVVPRVTAERIREFVDATFLERICIGRIVAVFGVSAAALQATYRERFGGTIGQRVRERRAGFARDAIERGDGSIADIALRAGFTDQSHMTRTFRRRFGSTPARLRAVARVRVPG